VIKLVPPLTGRWPLTTFPDRVTIDGFVFRRARFRAPSSSAVAQYREAVPFQSAHLRIAPSGIWTVTHLDDINPDFGGGEPLRHLLVDHPAGKLATAYSYLSAAHTLFAFLAE
jgi:hypothetical protein